jgi:hypothetical protein
MLPLWKIKHEIGRVFNQLTDLVSVKPGWLQRMQYDRSLRSCIRKIPGEVPIYNDIAIVLVYQPDGIPASLVCCLEHLKKKKVSTIVVSNAPLDEASTSILKEICFLIIERPNVGYDFGGYRDAILELFERKISPLHLFVLNDSNWFPIRHDCILIDKARADKSDLFGIFYDDRSKQDSKHFLHSYFYRFSQRLFESPVFHRYWTHAPMYDRKHVVIKKFERRLTAYFRKKGFSIGALYYPSDVSAAALSLPDGDLWAVVEQMSRRGVKRRPILSPAYEVGKQNGDWRPVAEDIIRNSRFKYYFLDTAPAILLGKLRTPILKKHTAPNFQEQRDLIFELGYDKELLPEVREEVRGWNDLIRANKKKTL